MTLYTYNGHLLEAPGGGLTEDADCCCEANCDACVEVDPLSDCECMSADYTESTQPDLQITIGGVVNNTLGAGLCTPFPATQAVSATFVMSCDEALTGTDLWAGDWVRHYQYCTYLVSGSTYRTYTMRVEVHATGAVTIGGSYLCTIRTSAFMSAVTHTGATPPTDLCTGAWYTLPKACGVVLGFDSNTPRERVASAVSAGGSYLRELYTIDEDCPEECQVEELNLACASAAFGSFTDQQTESTLNAHTNNVTLSAAFV